jgi:hypothetical protein
MLDVSEMINSLRFVKGLESPLKLKLNEEFDGFKENISSRETLLKLFNKKVRDELVEIKSMHIVLIVEKLLRSL